MDHQQTKFGEAYIKHELKDTKERTLQALLKKAKDCEIPLPCFFDDKQRNKTVRSLRKKSKNNKSKRLKVKMQTSRAYRLSLIGEHHFLLKIVFMIGRGVMLTKHLKEFSDESDATLWRKLRELEEAGLVHIERFIRHNVVQLSAKSMGIFEKKSPAREVNSHTVLLSTYLSEILLRFTKSNTYSLDYILSNFAKESTLVKAIDDRDRPRLGALQKKETLNKYERIWKALLELQHRNVYVLFDDEKSKIEIYLLDITRATMQTLVNKIFDIYDIVEGEMEFETIEFILCVSDDRRRRYISSASNQKYFHDRYKNKGLSDTKLSEFGGQFKLRVATLSLTENLFANQIICC